jgi:hypothetical protein
MSKFLDELDKLADVLTDEDRLRASADKGYKHARNEVIGKTGQTHISLHWWHWLGSWSDRNSASKSSAIHNEAILSVCLTAVITGRHDNPIEKTHDRLIAEINASHRFGSFASERADNFVKWYVPSHDYRDGLTDVDSFHRHIDGHDYMWAVSELIDRAKEVIFILVLSSEFSMISQMLSSFP